MTHRLDGVVESGFGLAASSLALAYDVIRQRTGLAISRGTLNVRLETPFLVIPDFIIEASEHDHQETLLLQRCRLYDAPALIVRTSTQTAGESHSLDVIEILATENLRESKGLADGDRIVIEVTRSL